RPDDHTYCSTTEDAISQLQRQGIEVFFDTGRPLHDNRDLMEQFQVSSYIGYNGSYAIYKNEPIWNQPLPSDVINRFLKIATDHRHELAFYTHEKITLLHRTVRQQKYFQIRFNLNKMHLFNRTSFTMCSGRRLSISEAIILRCMR